jgi:hypothetical protein
VTTGPGKPDLAKAPDMMADETRMAYAALFAPVVGIVAGALRLGSRLSGEDKDAKPSSPPTGPIDPKDDKERWS